MVHCVLWLPRHRKNIVVEKLETCFKYLFDFRESEEGKRLIPLRQTMVIVDGEVWVSFFGIDPYHEADV